MKIKRFLGLFLSLALCLTACSPTLLTIDGHPAQLRGHMVELNGEYAALSDIYPGENYLNLYDDGTGIIAFSGEEDEITWRLENKTYYICVQGEDSPATFSDGILTMNLQGGIITYVSEGAEAPQIPTTEPPAYDTDLSVPYGTYHGLTINEFGTVNDIVDYYKGECFIRLDDHGMGILSLGGSKIQIAWEINDTELTIADENGINSIGYLNDGILVLDYMESGIQLAFAKEGADN